MTQLCTFQNFVNHKRRKAACRARSDRRIDASVGGRAAPAHSGLRCVASSCWQLRSLCRAMTRESPTGRSNAKANRRTTSSRATRRGAARRRASTASSPRIAPSRNAYRSCATKETAMLPGPDAWTRSSGCAPIRGVRPIRRPNRHRLQCRRRHVRPRAHRTRSRRPPSPGASKAAAAKAAPPPPPASVASKSLIATVSALSLRFSLPVPPRACACTLQACARPALALRTRTSCH
jgi:hypothetical protein